MYFIKICIIIIYALIICNSDIIIINKFVV